MGGPFRAVQGVLRLLISMACFYVRINGDSTDIVKLTKNCSYVLHPPYAQQVKQFKADFGILDRDYGLRCTRKPERAITSFGYVDAEQARNLIASYGDEVWEENNFRQKNFAVHRNTQSVMLLWKRHLLTDILEYPRWSDWEPLFQPILERFCEKMGYSIDEVDIWKAVLARLRPGTEILPHADSHLALAFPHRVHWVISTEPGKVHTMIGGTKLDLQPDFLFEFNNVEKHSIDHKGREWRVHAILDVVPKKTHRRRMVSDVRGSVRDEL